jgi:hypothetical protein
MREISIRNLLCIAVVVLVAGADARADTIFQVSLDTSPLAGIPGAGPFSVDFQLTDGSGTGDGNNAASIGAFQFGGGAPVGTPSATGGAAGDLSTGIALTDSAFLNDFQQQFAPGSVFGFTVDLTTNVDPAGTPDEFSFSILDSTGFAIPTTAPNGTEVFLVTDITGPAPAINLYPTDPSQQINATGAPPPAIAPELVPEPAELRLACIALGLLAASSAFPRARWRLSRV